MLRAFVLYRLAQIEELYKAFPQITYKEIAYRLGIKYDTVQKTVRRSGRDRRAVKRSTEDRRKSPLICPKSSGNLDK